MPLTTGTRIAAYEILTLAGAGGMGEVYRARDTRLGRDVAIKILGPNLVGNPDAVARFEREARTASSLNHPNIVHIYDIGEVSIGGATSRYIAMEFVAGETLRSRMRAGTGAIELLPLLAGAADGLAKAHAAGVVHRDLKPDNIMVAHDGYAKIVDFGLAKLVERSTIVQPDTTRLEDDHVWTGTGAVLGTASYMSPEQARGEESDSRSDIFSLGCILYEAISGRSPFKRSSSVDTLHAVIHEPPPRLDTPAELDALTALALKCLEKSPDRRPQNAADVATALRSMITTGSSPTITMPGTPARAARRTWIVVTSGVITLAVAAVALWGTRSGSVVVDGSGISVAKVTNRGDVFEPRVSPDGRYLAYATPKDATVTIMLRDLRDQSERALVSGFGDTRLGGVIGLDITSLGDSVTYATGDRSRRQLFRLPIIGGTPQLIYEWAQDRGSAFISPDANRAAEQRIEDGSRRLVIKDLNTGRDVVVNAAGGQPRAWSLDGTQLLFARTAGRGVTLHVQPIDRDTDRQVAVLDQPPLAMAWNAAATAIAFFSEAEPQSHRLFTVDLASGAVRPLGDRLWNNVRGLRWLGDAAVGVLDESRSANSANQEIWVVSHPDGQAVKLTPDTRRYWDFDATADGRTVITTEVEARADLMVSGDAGRSFTRATGGTNMTIGVSWTADGRLVYSSNEAGSYDLYVIDADGSNRRRLTFDRDHDETQPAVSPDNRYIVFVSNQSGTEALYRIRIDGGDLKPLTATTAGRRDVGPQFTPDGTQVLFLHWENGPTLWRIPIDGGEAARLHGAHTAEPSDAEVSAFGGTLSPDGKRLAFIRFDFDPVNKRLTAPVIAVASYPDGKILSTYPYKSSVSIAIDEHVQWSADGQSLYYLVSRGGPLGLWRQPVNGTPGQFITSFEMGAYDFDWSRDGTRLVVSRSAMSRDAVLITDFLRPR